MRLVLAVAGNKNDMYEYEEVPEAEAKGFAKDIGAIFQTTSAKISNGVDDLFKMIGEKFLHPDSSSDSGLGGGESKEKDSHDKVKLKKKDNGGKKGCC